MERKRNCGKPGFLRQQKMTPKMTESEIVAELFKMYERLTETTEKNKRICSRLTALIKKKRKTLVLSKSVCYKKLERKNDFIRRRNRENFESVYECVQ